MSLFERCTNIAGEPWTIETRTRILDYMQRPTKDLWDDIHGIIINRKGRTIWQAICRLDPTFPRTGSVYDLEGNMLKDFDKIPNPFAVIKAIQAEIEDGLSGVDETHCIERLPEHQKKRKESQRSW